MNLGIWCENSSSNISEKDSQTLNYHWSDREKAYVDFIYLQELKHYLLPILSDNLNKMHKTNYDVRSWNTIIGYWLHSFLTVTFDRWSQLVVAKSKNCKLRTYVQNYNIRDFVPEDTAKAISQFNSDDWNHVFISELLKYFPSIVINREPIKLIPKSNKINENWNVTLFLRKSLLRIFNYFLNLISFIFCKSSKKLILSSPYLSISKIFKLAFKFRGKLIFLPKFNLTLEKKINYDYREWEIPPRNSHSEFEKILFKLLPIWMPTIFLENYSFVKSKINKCLPKSSDIIFTANSHNYDDIFKIWVVGQLLKKSKLVIGLHGGGPPFKFHSTHQHEIEIADIYLVNGKADKRYSHFKTVGQFWNIQKVRKNTRGRYGIIVSSCPSKYAMDSRSMLTSSHMPDYFKNQFEFFSGISTKIQKQIKKFGYIRTILDGGKQQIGKKGLIMFNLSYHKI